MQNLTAKQRTVLLFLWEYSEKHGFPPTIREICTELNISSTNGANDHLKALEKKGFIVRDTGKSRAIRLTTVGLAETGASPEQIRDLAAATNGGQAASTPATMATIESIHRVPLLGKIAAGLPVEAIEDHADLVAIEPSILGRYSPSEVFALKVSGESMIKDGILDGDIVFIRRQTTGNRGETLAVMWNGEATLKRWMPQGDRVVLMPANDDMEPIIVPRSEANDLQILGKAIGLYRKIAF